ncbi:UTP--glucose-1-phosphate uridylyltransferase GalU [Radiobacillus deserti]|uniref:UTP--glucose-1-phosphate uridylyltransferase n=1 Tax=Radiobacillus deserti TaxID=2594883 RepID=A0A516KIP3_9BACI|nr:UTP--glucose-1-phosphate uridylyltransferase GalU [Radiobacillus deserti]QDP41263.1 UTP--glucose-1-phosphate uridylyltransferase GalU [Radiobacillus deserti]
MKIRKAIIPAAGLGTRFLPATKAMPKEMLPVIDKPTIQYIVEEAIESGIEDLIIVTGKGKRAIEDHFDHAFELEDNLYKKGKLDLLEQITQTAKVDIHYIRQKEPKGLGHAIWCARKFIGDEPFAVLLGDDIVQAETPCLKQLIDEYETNESSIIGIKEVSDEETKRYGIIAPESQTNRTYKIKHLVEKPLEGTAPSRLAIMGRYILTPEILPILEQQEIGTGGEIQLTDALEKLSKIQPIYGYEFEGKRYDVGDKLGFIQTTLEMALAREDMQKDIMNMLNQIMENHKLKS